MNGIQRLFKHPLLIKLFNWEYWSFGTVYTPVYPFWFYLSLRSRSFFFFSAANPSINYGGFLGESKKDIHAIMPSHLYPPTIHFPAGEKGEIILNILKEKNFEYPLVGKPDMGGKGRGVKVLKSDEDVRQYALTCEVDFHIQKFIDYPKEAGIFYYRYPGEKTGHISGIVSKEFLTVKGDGHQTIKELIVNDNRALLQMKNLEKMHGNFLNTVLPDGKEQVLVPFGNHARGAKFLDDTHLADEQLENVIDKACSQVKDFYFGRLDVRFNTWDELKEGKNFCIIEVNGAGSEPTHMYDPSHSLIFAWKEIIRHWRILWKISRMNHARGHRYMSVKEGMAMFRKDKANSAKIEAMM